MFSADELIFRDEVRTFLEKRLTPELRAGAAATTGVFAEPDIGNEWHRILNEKGWLAYHWPAEYGGTGWTPVQRYIFEKECAIAGSPSLPAMGLQLLAPVVIRFGTEAQKQRILPRILSGADYWCQGFSEPGSGSDLASLKTTARRTTDGYAIDGTKLWTTHAQHANKIFCLVRTHRGERLQEGISFILVDMEQPGVRVRPIINLAGDHEINEVFFDGAAASSDDLIGEEGQGWAIAKFLLENERGGSCHAPKLLSDLQTIELAAAGESDGYGQVLAETREWKRRVARIRLRAEALEMTELRILAALSNGDAPGPQTSLTKLIASSLRQEIDLLAVDLYGQAGLELEPTRPLYGEAAPPARRSSGAQAAAPRYLNSRAWTIFGGTNEIQANIIAKTVLGL